MRLGPAYLNWYIRQNNVLVSSGYSPPTPPSSNATGGVLLIQPMGGVLLLQPMGGNLLITNSNDTNYIVDDNDDDLTDDNNLGILYG